MFVKITNGQVAQYPYTVGDLRRDNPNVSFPKNIPTGVMARYGMFPVGYVAAPEFDPETHRIEHSNVPELVDGKWVLTKTVVALTEAQIADKTAAKAKEARKRRNDLIAETDFMALSDVTMPEDVAAYRQALRDITDQPGFPHTITWPVKP